MRAAHISLVSRLRLPALVWMRGARPFANAEARTVVDDVAATHACIAHCEQVVSDGLARRATLVEFDLAFLPLFDDAGNVEAVLVAAVGEAEVPRLLHRLALQPARLASVLNGLPHVVFTARPSGEVDYVNRHWNELTGPVTTVNRTQKIFDRIVGDVQAFRLAWRSGIASGDRFSLIATVRTVSGRRRFEVSVSPIHTNQGTVIKWIGVLSDVEDALVARETLAASERWFETLAAAGDVLGRAATIEEIVDGLAELPPILRAATLFVEIQDFTGARATTRPAIAPELRKDIAIALATSARTHRRSTEMRNLVVVALASPDRGFLAVSLPPLTSAMLDTCERLLHELARRTSAALERVRAAERASEIAAVLQRSMLPLAFPQMSGLYFDVAYEPAERDALVGGDWYDAFEMGDGRVAIAIGDVAGHGIPAAIVMSRLRQAMRAAALEGLDAAGVLERANRIVEDEDVPLVTAFFGLIDPLRLEIAYANAGHLPPLVVDTDGATRTLDAHGAPLGVTRHLALPLAVEPLPPGGALVLYTDGVVENERDLEAGQRNLELLTSRWAVRGFRERAADLQREMLPGPQHDDAATFALRFPQEDELAVVVPASPINASRIRVAVERFIARTELSEVRRFDAALAIAEAVNNASEHAYRSGEGDVSLRLRRESRSLVALVVDRGSWKPKVESDRGRGMFLMENLADDVSVATTVKGTNVMLRFDYNDSSEQTRTSSSSVS